MCPTTPDPPYRRLSEYLSLIPGHRGNARPHPSTLSRWCTVGVRLPDGSRRRLRAVRCGSRWLTTDVWFGDFVTALTAAHAHTAPAAEFRTPSERSRASHAADAKLRELG